MIPSKIKIECFAKRFHMDTLGGKGLILNLILTSFYNRYINFSKKYLNNVLNNVQNYNLTCMEESILRDFLVLFHTPDICRITSVTQSTFL